MPFSLFSSKEFFSPNAWFTFQLLPEDQEDDTISIENFSQLALQNLFVYAWGFVLLLTCYLVYRHQLNGLGVPATSSLTHPWQIESHSCSPEMIAYIHKGPYDAY